MGRILYVEDDLSLSFVTRDQLKKNGYEVISSDNGNEAFQIFKTTNFDICILDVMLPEMDGFELAKKIREINKQVPILFLTARSMQEDKIEGLKLGGDDYMTKPFNIEELCLKIEVYLKRKEILKEPEKHYKTYSFSTDPPPRATKNITKPMVFQQIHPLGDQKHYNTYCFSTNPPPARPNTLQNQSVSNNPTPGRPNTL